MKLTTEFLKKVISDYLANKTEPRLYFGVKSETVQNILEVLLHTPVNLVLNAREIGTYIENNKDSLGNWYIYVANGSEQTETEIASILVQQTKRRMPLIN